MSRSYRIGIDARLYEETGVGRYIQNLITHLSYIDTRNHYVLLLRRKTFEGVSLPGKNFSKVIADVRWHTPQEQLLLPYLLNKINVD